MKRQSHKILIRNQSPYPDEEVKPLIKKVLRDMECRNIMVVVKIGRRQRDCDPWYGASGYYRSYWYPKKGEDRPVILIRMPRLQTYPAVWHPYKRTHQPPPAFQIENWQEGLVAVLGHEAQHHRQNAKRSRFVEQECDWAAYRAVRYYREDRGLPEPTIATKESEHVSSVVNNPEAVPAHTESAGAGARAAASSGIEAGLPDRHSADGLLLERED